MKATPRERMRADLVTIKRRMANLAPPDGDTEQFYFALEELLDDIVASVEELASKSEERR